MADKRLADLADRMAGIDLAILTTRAAGGGFNARPMSNNGEVEYNGESFYFTRDGGRIVPDIEGDARVSLGFDSGDGFWLTVDGEAELIRDKPTFEDHWTPDLDKWFEQGADTPGLVLVKVAARRVRYWDGEDEGEIAC